MSIYTVNGSPVMHDGKFLTTGGSHDLPEYDTGDANKVLKVSPDGHSIDWYDDANTTYTAGNGLTLTGTEFAADTTVLATQTDLSGKQDKLTAGQNITIDADNVISATGGGSTYTAGTGIDITGDVISADTTVLATQQDLTGKQDTLTAGTNITIQNNVISATAAPQVQSDWAESNTADVSYIQNKPTEKTLAAGSNVTITEASNIVTISATDTTYSAGSNITISGGVISAASQVQADYTQSDTNAVDYIKNKPTIPTATSDLNNDSGFITSSDVPSAQVQSDWNESNSSSAAYIVNKPTIPTVPTTDQTYSSSSTNPQSGTAVAGALATVTLSTLNTAGITDIQQVASLPANPVATVLYLIPST